MTVRRRIPVEHGREIMSKRKEIFAILLAVAAVAFWWMGRPSPPHSPGTGLVAPSVAPAAGGSAATPGAGAGATHRVTAPDGMGATGGVSQIEGSASVVTPQAPVEDPVDPAATPSRPALVRPSEEEAIQALRLSVRSYGQKFLGNPVGNNAEITAALNGENPRGIRYLEGQGARINDRGELMDQWDTPYFFHQLSKTSMEIRSAGPDRTMGTEDDVINP